MSKTVKEICDIIFSLEKKYNLNNMKIQEIYPWQLIRIYIYYEITRKIGVFGSPQQGKVTFKDKILSFIPFIKNSLFSNPLAKNYHKDILIFDHPRKIEDNENYKDIYSYFLVDYFNNSKNTDKNSFEVIETPYLNKHYTKKENYIKYNDRILLGSYFYKKRSKIKFTTLEKEKISKIQTELISKFNIKIDLFNIIHNHILDFKYQYNKYDKLFKKRTPKYVFVVVAYENQAMISAAKDNNIEVIELQHGTISNYHLGYNYPQENADEKDYDNIEYFPNKILSFGEYWKEVANYPIEKDNIIAIGYPYLEKTLESYVNIEKSKNQIIFISQGVIGKYLSEFAYKIAMKLKKNDEKYSIIYKLHPGEYSNWEINYPYLKKAKELDNFTIMDNNKISLYGLLSKSEYQIGVFSTAIYEGLFFNCKTFILNLPGSEYMDSLVEKNYVKKIVTAGEFIDSIANFKINNYDKDFFFKKYDESNLNKLIKK